MNWEIREYSVGFAVEQGELVMVYRRSWMERLFSWPWRPWVTEAIKPTLLGHLAAGRVKAMQDMGKCLSVGIYGPPV